MAWTSLIVAGLLEVVWVFLMKQSHGFTRPVASLATVACMTASFGLLAFAMRTLPMGTSYAVWTGIGAVGAFVVGVVVLGESLGLVRLLAALLISSGIGLMYLADRH